ncbi:MAG TPA: alpha/beta hydrolase [Streptosporangiaceae bacterium]
MNTLHSYDGTLLSYRRSGVGETLVVVPGPGRDADYLGDLGGLAGLELVTLELRGTGGSAVPQDSGTYRYDRMAGDVEALRLHLGAESIDLLAHSAAADIALVYAASYPDRVRRLVLVTPELSAIELDEEDLLALASRRSGEPWYADARAGLVAALEGGDVEANRPRFAPFLYGRWDDAARAHVAAEAKQLKAGYAAAYYADGAIAPMIVRDQLAALTAPVLVVAGELDLSPAVDLARQVAAVFVAGELAVIGGAAHFPWLDARAGFADVVTTFLRLPRMRDHM